MTSVSALTFDNLNEDMRKRTQAREYALQLLYEYDIIKDLPENLTFFWSRQEEPVDEEVKGFAEELVRGTVKYLKDIDKKVSGYATNWNLNRMAVVDRNVLRLGSFELLYLKDVPAKVSINEAVDLAKKYSGEDSGKFVNGILDRIKDECGKD